MDFWYVDAADIYSEQIYVFLQNTQLIDSSCILLIVDIIKKCFIKKWVIDEEKCLSPPLNQKEYEKIFFKAIGGLIFAWLAHYSFESNFK